MGSFQKVIAFFLPVAFILALAFVSFQPVYAINGYGALVPCGTGGPNGSTSGTSGGTGPTDCNFSDLIILINNIIDYLIIIAMPIAGLVFVYAGFIILSAGSSSEKRNSAKHLFTSVLIGFIWLLGGWAIIHWIASIFLSSSYSTYLGS